MKTNLLKVCVLASLSAMLMTGVAGAGETTPPPAGKNPYIEPMPDICGPWFAGIMAGPWWVQDYGINVPFVPVAGAHELEFETGFGVNVTPIGYRVSELFAVSLEGGWYQSDIDSVTLPAGGGTVAVSDGQLRLFPIMVNAMVTVPITDGFLFYLGVGAGGVYRDLEVTAPAALFLAGGLRDGGWDFMMQARAGVMFEVARCLYVNVGYRYNRVFTTPEDINGHMAEAGVTFMWD